MIFRKLLLNKEMDDDGIVNNNVLIIVTGFKTIILCSVYAMWFVKNLFSAKIWFSWKLRLELKNKNHESSNQTPTSSWCKA